MRGTLNLKLDPVTGLHDLDVFDPHQANMRIIDEVYAAAGLPPRGEPQS